MAKTCYYAYEYGGRGWGYAIVTARQRARIDRKRDQICQCRPGRSMHLHDCRFSAWLWRNFMGKAEQYQAAGAAAAFTIALAAHRRQEEAGHG